LASVRKLKIKQSLIPGAGKGLFVWDTTKPAGEVVFRRNQLVTPYEGEHVTAEELQERYGDFTAPYICIVPDA
jgi:hypothetical protein